MAKPDVLRSSSFHASFVGLLKLDYEYTGVDGGIDDETALGFPVRAVTVRGLTFERAQAGELTPGLEAAFKGRFWRCRRAAASLASPATVAS